MSLYEDLGVEPTADANAIKKAHRKAVQKHHPDKGGDREKFERVQKAYLVLSNPLKREKYDRTGDESETIDNHLANIAGKIVGAFGAAMSKSGEGYRFNDIIAMIKEELENQVAEVEDAKHNFEKTLERCEDVKKRLSFKGKTPDFILTAIESDEKHLRANIQSAIAEIDLLDDSIEYLDNYGFTFDEKPVVQLSWYDTQYFDQRAFDSALKQMRQQGWK